MNADDDTNLHPWIEPELEARLTALVLGEASDFERDELERLVAERPELGLYRKRLEAMHRMLREVAEGESGEEQGEWRLGAERRAVVLARLSGEAKAKEEKVVVMSRPKRRLPWGMAIRIAACVAVIALLLGLMFPATTGALRKAELPGDREMGFASSESGGDSGQLQGDGFDTVRPLEESFRGGNPGKYSPAQKEWRHYPLATEEKSEVVRESQDLALADRAIRLPAPTSATPASSAEPMAVDKPGQIGALNGTVAIGAGGDIDPNSPTRISVAASGSTSTSVRVGGGFDGRNGGGRALVEKPVTSTLGGENPYTGGTAITGGGVLAVNSPESASFAAAATSVPGLPDGSIRQFTDEEKTAIAAASKSKHDSQSLMESEKRASDDVGSLAVNQTLPAPVASPKPVTAAPASVPAVAGEPVLEQQVTKLGAGTLALNGGVTEVDRFVDSGKIDTGSTASPAFIAEDGDFLKSPVGASVVRDSRDNLFLSREWKNEAANEPVVGANLNFPGDLQITGGGEATGKVAMDGRVLGSGGVVGAVSGNSVSEGFDFIAPNETDGLNRSQRELPKEMADTSRLGRSTEVDKSVEDILALTPSLRTKTNAVGSTWDGSADSPVPVTEKIRAAAFYDVGEVTDGPATNSGGSDTKHYFARAGDPNGGFNVKYRPTPIDPADPTNAIYSAILREAPKPTPAALDEISPSAEPFSTFSLHVSDVSFQLAKSSLASGKWPEAEKIRIEEFVNAFDYGDPVPSMGERVACRIDQGAHPFLQQRNLVRIALRTAEAGRSSGTPLRLTLLLDSSGSMERPDRRVTLTRALAILAGLLGEGDRITLVSFARQPRLVADAVAGNEAMKLADTVAALPSEGGTNLEAALELAFEKAREHREANAQNRIVLLTDGAANLGDAKAESLGARVEMMRDNGIAFDAAGFGAEGLNDEILEALTRKGDGRYYLLDRPEDAGEAFAEQIAGALRPAAKNVKVQVEFNPDRVKSYKLLGFEKHRLATEDFRNDAVDAAELAAAEAGVAVYQVEPDPAGEGDLGSVSVRFRDLESGEMIERRWSLPHLAAAPAPVQGGDAILLATVASQFAAKLAGGPVGDVVDLGELARLAAALPESERVKELRTMIEQARNLEGVSVSF